MSEIPAGLESLSYCFAGGRPAGAFAPVLVGVVGLQLNRADFYRNEVSFQVSQSSSAQPSSIDAIG